MIANTLFPAQQEDTVAGLTLEACVRTALELGELSPGMEARICAYAAQPVLSDRDQRLLHLLQDALAEGCIRRLKPSSPCQGSGICSLPLSSSSGSVSKEGSK